MYPTKRVWHLSSELFTIVEVLRRVRKHRNIRLIFILLPASSNPGKCKHSLANTGKQLVLLSNALFWLQYRLDNGIIQNTKAYPQLTTVDTRINNIIISENNERTRIRLQKEKPVYYGNTIF